MNFERSTLMDKRLNRLGEFTDKGLEKEFCNQDMKKAMTYIKPVILLLGILYTLFIIPDYFFIQSGERFRDVLYCRIFFILLVVFLLVRLNKTLNYRLISIWVTVYEVVAAVLFMFVFYQYENPDFLIQAFGIMIIILAVFMVPNRWGHMVMVSLITLASFAFLSLYFAKGISPSHFWAGIVYNLVVIVLGSITSYRSHSQKRINYVVNKELIRLSTTDSLTGIHNRAKFDEELDKCEASSKRYGTPLSLIIFDFDNFKDINDTYGHQVGDRVMVEVVAIIDEKIRGSDIFARWGGEEFVLLLPNTIHKAAADLAERLRLKICEHVFDVVGRVSCSFGVAELTRDEAAESLVNRADKLLYQAKNEGRNRVKS